MSIIIDILTEFLIFSLEKKLFFIYFKFLFNKNWIYADRFWRAVPDAIIWIYKIAQLKKYLEKEL